MIDVAIIGAGPAGLSAALYAARAGLSVRMFDGMGGGGQLTEAAEVENYLGVGKQSGAALADACLSDAKAAGAELICEAVGEVRKAGLFYEVVTKERVYEARTVILANGARPRPLSVQGEKELLGKGVSYCALCDGRFFVGKRVAVVGGGSSALSEALYLSRLAGAVHIVHRNRHFRGERALYDRLVALPNVIFHTDRQVERIAGDECVRQIVLRDTVAKKAEILVVDGVFIAIGREPQNGDFASVFPLDEQGYVLTDKGCACAVQGLFAAGDTRQKELRQISTAVADGALAAESARRYLFERAFVPNGR